MSIRRRKTILICLAVGLLAFAYAAWYRSNSVYQHFASGVPDDASYYLKPALNYAVGNGSTFDGVHSTNGYQPLWFITLVTFFKFLPLEQMTLVNIWYSSLLLQAVIVGVFTSLFSYFLYRFTQSSALAAILGFLPLLLMPNRILNLLETPLQLLLLSIIFIQLFNLFERPAYEDFRERLFLIGISVGILFLARTDGIAMIPALLLPLSIKFRRNLKRLNWFVAPAVAIIAGYMTINYINFGVLMPVSGAVKLDSLYRVLYQNPDWWQFVLAKLKFIFGPDEIGTPMLKILLQSFAFVVPVIIIVRQVRGKILSNAELILLGIGSFLLFKYLAYTTIYHSWRANAYWYWVSDVIIWFVVASAIAKKVWHQFIDSKTASFLNRVVPALMVGILSASVILGITTRAAERIKPIRDTSVLLDLANFVKAHDYFEDKKLGAYNAGILGYFSGRQFENLDGLVNSPSFAKLIRMGRRDDYIRQKIDILVEYHASFVPYYAELGFKLYNVRRYIQSPAVFNPDSGDDYRIYVRSGLQQDFEDFLGKLSSTARVNQ